MFILGLQCITPAIRTVILVTYNARGYTHSDTNLCTW